VPMIALRRLLWLKMDADCRRAISSSLGCRHVPGGGVGAAGGTACVSGVFDTASPAIPPGVARAVEDIVQCFLPSMGIRDAVSQ
jgi:hypothetical protein